MHISRKVVQELLKIPRALMERLTKWIDLNCVLSSDKRGEYLLLFLFEFDTRLASKPIVSSKT